MGQICKAILGSPTRTQDKACTKTIVAYDKANPGNECASKPNLLEKAACYKDKVISPNPTPPKDNKGLGLYLRGNASVATSSQCIGDSYNNSCDGLLKTGSFFATKGKPDWFPGVRGFGGIGGIVPITDDIDFRLGLDVRRSAIDGRFDETLVRKQPSIETTSYLLAAGIERRYQNFAFGADMLFGVVNTKVPENQQGVSFPASPASFNLTTGKNFDDLSAPAGGARLSAAYYITENIKLGADFEFYVDGLSKQISKPEEISGPFTLGTYGFDTSFGLTLEFLARMPKQPKK